MKAQTDYKTDYDTDHETRIRAGILPWGTAETLIAERARLVRFDAWQLNIDPIDLPIQRRMGIRHPIDIRHKFLHLFPVLLDQAGGELLALHTMPIAPGRPDLPATMGTAGSTIRVFAMTPAASAARFERDQHKALPPTAALPLTNPAARAGLVARFADNMAVADYKYKVPVAPVRHEFMRALSNSATLPRNPIRHTEDRLRRRQARKILQAADDETLAERLNAHCTYALAAVGENSNSGAVALRELLDYPQLPYTAAEAPFIENSLLAGQTSLLAQLERVNTMATAVAALAPERPHGLLRGLFRHWLPQPKASALRLAVA